MNVISSYNVAYKRILTLQTNDTELLYIEVFPFKSNCPIIVAGIYCLPDFTAQMDSKFLFVWSKEALLLDDFNINKSGVTSTITS